MNFCAHEQAQLQLILEELFIKAILVAPLANDANPNIQLILTLIIMVSKLTNIKYNNRFEYIIELINHFIFEISDQINILLHNKQIKLFYYIKTKIYFKDFNYFYWRQNMKSFIRLAVLALIIILAVSNVHLNVKYRNFLSGQGDFSAEIARDIYSQFRTRHHQKSEYRFNIFLERLEKIRSHNSGSSSYRKGLNEFSDMTFEQFKNKKLMAPQTCSATSKFKVDPQVKLRSIPTAYEWQSYGVVTAVKDQGECGSCWTFSTVGAMQSHWNILGKGRNTTFSEQQLVDCAGDFDNNGCNGGLPSHAFEYIRHVGGIETQLTYPYTGRDGKCVFRKNIAVGYARFGSYNITQGDENELAQRLYNAGPIAVSFEVTDDFVEYQSGIFSEVGCGTTDQDVNHAVLATGYGVENGKSFWNVKNSWSTQWGNQGYFKIVRGQNMCAIAQCNSYPMIDSPNNLIEVKTK